MRTPTLLSLVIGLVVLSGLFWVLERWRPSIPGQQRTRVQTITDLTYWFFTPLVTRLVTRAALGLVFVLLALWQGLSFQDYRQAVSTRQTWASSLPTWVQIPLILLLADLLAFYMPVDRQPQRFGIVNDDVPEGLLAQLAYPLRAKR